MKKISLSIILLTLLFLLMGSVSAESLVSQESINNDNLLFESVSAESLVYNEFNNPTNSENYLLSFQFNTSGYQLNNLGFQVDGPSSKLDSLGFQVDGSSSKLNNSKYTIENESFYNKTSLNEDIQNILDNAYENSTIEFLGSKYSNLHLIIKKPLNLIGSNVFINSSLNKPIFTVCSSASGTNISGFNILSSGSSAIYLDGVSDVTISDININSSGNGIDIIDSKNVNINSNSIKSSKIGINLYNSEGINIIRNNITGINKTKSIGIKLYGCKGIKSNIELNYISYFDIGIKSEDNVKNIDIKSNKISYCNNAIFLNSGINMDVKNNTLKNNYEDSLVLNGKSDNLIIKSNIFSGNGGGGFVIGDSYDFSSNNGLKLYANYFTKNKDFDIQSNGYDLIIDYNIANHICPRVNMKNYNLKTFNEGNKYGIGIYTAEGKLATDLPTFTTIINTNNGFQEVTFVNGKAQFDLEFNKDSYLELTYGTKVYRGSIDKVLRDLSDNKNIEKDSKDFFDSNVKDNINSNDSQINNRSESVNSTDLSESVNTSDFTEYSNDMDISGLVNNKSSGDYYLSSHGSNSKGLNSLSSQGITSKSASSSSPILRYVTVDEEVYKIAGVMGLVITIILSIGLYYSRDIYNMLKK